MITASLHTSVSLAPNSLGEARATIERARTMARQLYTSSRSRLARYLHIKKRVSFEQGYREGLAQAHADISLLAQNLRQQYSTLLDLAHADAHRIALAACEHFLDERFSIDSSPLFPWLQSAVEIMKSSRSITIAYNPRLGTSLEMLRRSLGSHISIVSGPPSQTHDFVVHGEFGEVELSWREALRTHLSSPTIKREAL